MFVLDESVRGNGSVYPLYLDQALHRSNPAPQWWFPVRGILMKKQLYNLVSLVCRQGAELSTDEVGASAILAVQMDDELGGGAEQVQEVGPLDPDL